MSKTSRKKGPRKAELRAAWERAGAIKGMDADIYRMDRCQRWIRFADYGDGASHFGWEIEAASSSLGDGELASEASLPVHWLTVQNGANRLGVDSADAAKPAPIEKAPPVSVPSKPPLDRREARLAWFTKIMPTVIMQRPG